MTDPTLISLFVRPLNQLRIPYLVTGGVASVVYGEPRFTRDIDLVIALDPRDAPRFAGAWPAADFYVPPVETIAEEAGRETAWHFNVIHQHTTMRADIYLPGNDPLNAWSFAAKAVRSDISATSPSCCGSADHSWTGSSLSAGPCGSMSSPNGSEPRSSSD